MSNLLLNKDAEITFVKSDGSKETVQLGDFVRQYVLLKRDVSKSKGINSVYSGLNAAIEKILGYPDAKVVTNALRDQGVIAIGARTGIPPMIYLAEEAPVNSQKNVTDVTDQIKGKKVTGKTVAKTAEKTTPKTAGMTQDQLMMKMMERMDKMESIMLTTIKRLDAVKK